MKMQRTMYMDWMTACAAPGTDLESLCDKQWPREESCRKKMAEIGHNLDLLCSNLTVEDGLII